jgi:putative alpha-1,2-mannosidase
LATETISVNNDKVGAYLQFNTEENDTIYMKIAISFKSIERANEWLIAEIPDFDYESIKKQAILAWNNELQKIKIEDASETDMKIFYTAMYHSMLMPRNRTNDMQGFEDGLPVWDDHYAVWDTWRTLYPLHVLINPSIVSGTVNAFIARYKKNKTVKDAYIAGADMDEEQGGNNIDNIIADAYVKGVENINWNDAFEIIKYHAESNRGRMGWQGWENNEVTNPEMASYKTLGWIPGGVSSCSYTLEYAYNDYCAGLVASGMGKHDEANKYFNSSTMWINLWNPQAISDGFTGFIVPRKMDGTFIDIDLKKNWVSWNNYFYEGSYWTY